MITKFHLKTLGRESEGMEMKLHTKAEYKEKQESKKGGKDDGI